MTQKIAKKILIHEEKCTGCQICQLICSYTYQELFAPEQAYIQVRTQELIPQISFLEGCTNCHKCVQYCLYGALELKEGSE